jgi:hypothetical protein
MALALSARRSGSTRATDALGQTPGPRGECPIRRGMHGKRLVRRLTDFGNAAPMLAGSPSSKSTFGGSGAFAGRQSFVSQYDGVA